MFESKITRRVFGLLLPSVALLPQFSSGQTSATSGQDGDDWKAASQPEKFGYVLGFTDAAAWACANTKILLQLKSLSAMDRQIAALTKDVCEYEGIKFDQLIAGMDVFYLDYRNTAIKWFWALGYVRDTIAGTPQAQLDRELELARKVALKGGDLP